MSPWPWRPFRRWYSALVTAVPAVQASARYPTRRRQRMAAKSVMTTMDRKTCTQAAQRSLPTVTISEISPSARIPDRRHLREPARSLLPMAEQEPSTTVLPAAASVARSSNQITAPRRSLARVSAIPQPDSAAGKIRSTSSAATSQWPRPNAAPRAPRMPTAVYPARSSGASRSSCRRSAVRSSTAIAPAISPVPRSSFRRGPIVRSQTAQSVTGTIPQSPRTTADR